MATSRFVHFGCFNYPDLNLVAYVERFLDYPVKDPIVSDSGATKLLAIEADFEGSHSKTL